MRTRAALIYSIATNGAAALRARKSQILQDRVVAKRFGRS